MMVSLRKFKAIILDFKKSDLTNKGMVIDNRQNKTVSSIEHQLKIKL